MNFKNYFLIVSILFFYPSLGMANIIWPGLFLATRMVIWSIPVGILIEGMILKSIIKKGWGYTLYVTIVINLISVVFGALGALIGNLAFEFTIGVILFKFFNIGTFNPLSWSSAIILGALVSTVVEIISLNLFFKIKLTNKQWLWFLGANLISTLVAMLTVLIKPPVL